MYNLFNDLLLGLHFIIDNKAFVFKGRNAEIAQFICQSLRNREIADRLGVSTGTVRTHISKMIRELKLKNRTQLAVVFETRTP